MAPDWCYSVTGLAYPQPHEQALPTADDYAVMMRHSPVVHAHRVTTPTLICVGTGDRRVPIHQSIEYIKILKARGVATRLLSYADAQHGLADRPHTVEADSIINSLLWIEQHSTSASL